MLGVNAVYVPTIIEAIQEKIVVEGVSLIMYLKGTRYPQIKEASIVIRLAASQNTVARAPSISLNLDQLKASIS
jgi:hypothetical protein